MATTEIYALSLHDALPICARCPVWAEPQPTGLPGFCAPSCVSPSPRPTSRTSQSEGRRPQESIHNCPHLLAVRVGQPRAVAPVVDRAWPPDCPSSSAHDLAGCHLPSNSVLPVFPVGGWATGRK